VVECPRFGGPAQRIPSPSQARRTVTHARTHCQAGAAAASPALVEGGSLAYFTFRRIDGDGPQRRSELGAIGHGPAGPELAGRLCEQIRRWDRDRLARPVLTACPAGTPDDRLPAGHVIDKRCVRLVISY
jgi:protein-L-isoaspartate(D-aspartate) O-methyltransferase